MPKSTNTADEYDFVTHEETELSPEILAKVRSWLQPTDYLAESGEFRRHLSSQAPDTGLWICQTEEYRKWHDSPDHGSLWIKGVPGAGKSVMTASIIQHLRATENCPVLFFFFRNIIAANFSPRALIQDWLAQLLPYSPKLQFALEPLLQTSLEETSENELIQLFLDGISNIPKLYCIGDALDEIRTDNKLFLDKLNSLATFRPRSLKLLITSRPTQYLQSTLRDSSIIHVSLHQKLVDADIISYLNYRFDNALKSDVQSHIKEQVIDMVATRSEGLFLYGKLTMDQVEAALLLDNLVDVHALEGSLPVGLEQTYNSILAQQREKYSISTDLQVHVLQAVTHASRPLRLNELASLTRSLYPDLNAPAGFKSLIATSCGPLVEILEDETLQVIHHSFTEFLRGDTRNAPTSDASLDFPIINSKEAHKRMALSCLQYLRSGSLLLEGEPSRNTAADASVAYKKPRHDVDIDEEHYQQSHLGLKQQKDPFNYREARLLHPFVAYAVENWSYHASHYDADDEELFAAIEEFLNPDSLSFHRWLVLQWGSTSRMKGSTEGIPQALHIAAFSGLSKLVQKLIEQGSAVSMKDAQKRIPLHWAAAKGHAKVISLLIQHGSDPDAEDGCGLKPIHLAAKKNHALAVTALLEAGVEPNTIKTKENHSGRLLGGETVTIGECSILYATQAGYLETIIAILPFCKGKVLEQLLCQCCRYNRTDATLAILEQSDVSADAIFEGATALYFACGSANAKCVEALINRGADVRKTSSWLPRRFRNGPRSQQEVATAPLHRLVEAWNDTNHSASQEIFKLLVQANADIEQINGNSHSALILAAGGPSRHHDRPHVHAMRCLLEAGADATVTLLNGDTPLHVVLHKERNPEAVRLLIEHGCDPNQEGRDGKTPLYLSMYDPGMTLGVENTETIVKYLIEHGAETTNAIVELSMSAGLEVFRYLLSKCKTDDVKRRCWFKISKFRPIKKFIQYLELFLAEGIDIETRTSEGRSLYLCCLNDQDQLDTLQRYGAKTDVVDNSGRNALHILASSDRLARDRMERFIADGVDPLATSSNGDTLLHQAARWYNYEQISAENVRWLVSLGISVNVVNKQGLTALHVAQRAFPIRNRSDTIHFVQAINSNNDVDLEILDNDGLTALHMAAMQGEVQLRTLLAAGANLNTLTKDLQNVLHLACRARKPNVVGHILDLVDSFDVINHQDTYGRTPLHYACSSGQAESVRLLLDGGANAKAVDSLDRTALHACAEYRLEQNIWETCSQSNTWLRGPLEDSLWPISAASHLRWIPPRYMSSRRTREMPKMGNRYFHMVGTIAKLLLEADCDPSAIGSDGDTALDVALDSGCVEFSDVFAENEDLFLRATKRLENGKDTKGQVEEKRHLIRARMLLMRPKSSWTVLGNNTAVFDTVRKSPHRFLDLLTCEDAVQIINEGFESNPHDPVYYEILEKLMKPDYLQIIQLIPDLVMHYSTKESLIKMIERARDSGERYYNSSPKTALQLACQKEQPNMLVVQLLVEKFHVDVNARSALLSDEYYRSKREMVTGGTALHVVADASYWWQLAVMEYLIENGADVNAQDEKGQTPLHVASQGTQYQAHAKHSGLWRFEAARELLNRGADPNILDKTHHTPLHTSSSASDVMRLLLQRKADTSIGESPLFLAILDQNLEALEALLDHGVSVNSVNEKSHSRDVHYSLTKSRKVYALLCAAFAAKLNSHPPQSVPLLRALIERGADLYPPLNDEETLIHFIFEYPEYEILDALLKEPCASRIDFNRRDQRGRTVLIAACDWREVLPGDSYRHWTPPVSAPPVRMLDLGADATAVDNDGRTALHHILANDGLPDGALLDFINREEVAPTLFQKDNEGFSPFHYALRTLRPKACELMLEKGASLPAPGPDGRTALHYIADQCLRTSRKPLGHIATDLPEDYFDKCLVLWKRFIGEGGSINVADNEGNTPLLAFLRSPVMEPMSRRSPSDDTGVCHVETYDKLFPPGSGVDIFAANHAGETALHMIARREKIYYTKEGHDKALFEAMMAKGLDLLKEDIKGRSALDVADACGKDEIVGIVRRK